MAGLSGRLSEGYCTELAPDRPHLQQRVERLDGGECAENVGVHDALEVLQVPAATSGSCQSSHLKGSVSTCLRRGHRCVLHLCSAGATGCMSASTDGSARPQRDAEVGGAAHAVMPGP